MYHLVRRFGVSIRADASELPEVEKQMEVFIERCLFQFALMRVRSSRRILRVLCP